MHRTEKQIGLGFGNRTLADVFSHQSHRSAIHRSARQGTAVQSKAPRIAGWQQPVFRVSLRFKRITRHRIALQCKAKQRIAEQIG
jgi:hypothetical protein